MSGTEDAFNLTQEDVRKVAARESARHGGKIPADSEAAGLQSIVDSADKNKAELIAERQANLPLPDQPPQPSDWNSADARTVNVGSGGVESSTLYGGDNALRGPASGDSSAGVGREGAEGLGGLPNDAVARGSKNKPGLADTTGPDYGYPQKSDPADTSKLQ